MKYRVKRHTVVQPLNESYRLIPLTQGQNAIVDLEDFERLSRHNWHVQWNPNTKSFYALTSGQIAMHRMILGCKADEEGDHIDRNTLNNRRKNLRKCARFHQNNWNQGPNRRNTTGYKGVNWLPKSRKWQARIRANKKMTYLGLFESAEDAAHAYDDAARRLHGEFAFLNF
jgi:AP2 domain